MVHQRFNVGAIKDLPAEQLPEAVAYVHALTLHAGLAGEVLDAVSDPRGRAVVPDGEIADGIACLLAQSYRACGFLKRYLPAFRSLGLDAGVEMYGFVYNAAASRDAVNRWLHANRSVPRFRAVPPPCCQSLPRPMRTGGRPVSFSLGAVKKAVWSFQTAFFSRAGRQGWRRRVCSRC